jgi:ubiquitin carboxyl-terminal hydrolase 14
MNIDTPNIKPQLTGIYDLVAVLTHKGRSADSGHYVAWVKQESGIFSFALLFSFFEVLLYRVSTLLVKMANLIYLVNSGKWIEYDDDNPIPQREEDITKLSGGGIAIFIFHTVFLLWIYPAYPSRILLCSYNAHG